MVLEEAIIQRCFDGDRELITQLDGDYFVCQENIDIVKAILYADRSNMDTGADTIRHLINQNKRIQYKNKHLEKINQIETEVYGYYDDAITDLKKQWMYRNVSRIGRILAEAGTEKCTERDIETHATTLYDIFKHASETTDFRSLSEMKKEITTRKREDVNSKRIEITDPLLQEIFQKNLLQRLYVISGESSLGKNIVADNLVCDIIKNKSGAYFSFDNSDEETAMSIISIKSKVPYCKIHDCDYFDSEIHSIYKSTEDIKELFISSKAFTARQIRTATEKLMKNHDIDFIVIDYFTNIRLNDYRNPVTQYGEAVRELKNMCKELGLCVIVISQVNAEGELKFCRDLYQEAYYVVKIEGEKGTRERDVIISKYKKGELRSMHIEFNFSNGGICYGRR